MDYVSRGAVGAIELACVHDSDIRLTPEQLFLDWDEEAVAPVARLPGPRWYDPQRRIHTLPVHSWLIRTGRHTVLVDTCNGDDKQRPGEPDFHLLRTGFLDRLHAAGARPEDVDIVLCTHLHVDHVGWNTRLRDGRWVPTFPNGRYVISRVELDHAAARAQREPDGLTQRAYRDSVLPIIEAGLALAVDVPHAVDDTLTIHPAPGHTPGHVRVELRSRGALGALSGDVVHTPLQGPFWDWRTALSSDPDEDVRTRRALLEQCAEHDALLLPAHFHAPGCARVRAAGDGFAFDFGW